MNDVRDINFQRVRMWGYADATFCQVVSDDAFNTLFSVSEDFAVFETADEETGRATFEFRLYALDHLDKTLVDQADLIFFNGIKYERETHELKKQEPAHWKIVAVPVGVE